MITASYFDGRNARLHTVRLTLRDGAFTLIGGDIAKAYGFDEVRMAEPFAHAPCILECQDGARCEVSEPGAKAALAAALGYRPSAVVRWQRHWYAALAALLLLGAGLYGTVEWGVPVVAERVVAGLPSSADVALGKQTLEALETRVFAPSRMSDERLADIASVFEGVRPAHPRLPLRLLVRDMPGQPPNALALPDGTIIVTDAMVRLIMDHGANFSARERAQLAGVLAHEIGHVEGRHSMRIFARSALVTMGSGALFGDFSAVAAGAPALLKSMEYSRAMESDADAYAIARLQALGISTAPLAQLFTALEATAPPDRLLPKWMRTGMSYVSSHPATQERSARFRAATKAPEEALDD
ncbi:MAG: M48 family metallopeptidase [Pseudomonadota bacterium]